jgi:hypothetical protein
VFRFQAENQLNLHKKNIHLVTRADRDEKGVGNASRGVKLFGQGVGKSQA